MTDGNTGIQVAPIAEDEAMRLHDMFSKAANAIVSASTFPKQVAELEAKVTALSQDLEAKRIHAEELDRTLHEVREQRDQARSDKYRTETERDELSRMLSDAQRSLLEQDTKLDSLSHDLDTTKAERDNYGLRAMQLEDEVASWKAKAEATRAKLDDIATMFKAEPEPEKPTELPAFLEPEPEPTAYQAPPAEPPKPEPEQAKPDWADEWEPGYVFDRQSGRYHRPDIYPDAEATKPNDDIPF